MKPSVCRKIKKKWVINSNILCTGHRFRPAYEFDYVALDILSVYAEDSGVYTCKASNKLGEAVTSATVKCIGKNLFTLDHTSITWEFNAKCNIYIFTAKKQLLLESQHPEGLQKIQHLEDTSKYQRDSWVQEEIQIKPRFLTKLNLQENLKESQNAHFECRLEPVTDTNLKIEWFHNGKPVPFGKFLINWNIVRSILTLGKIEKIIHLFCRP